MPERVVSVKVSDAEPVRSFMAGVAEAWKRFEPLGAEALAALPEDVREGIAGIRQAIAELVGEAPPRRLPEGAAEWGTIIIEWPDAEPYAAPMRCCKVSVFDALTGSQITTCASADIILPLDASRLATADLTLFADEDGKPVLNGQPVIKDGEILTGVFPFLVSEMRVRPA